MKTFKKGLRLIALALIIGLACVLPVPINFYRKDNLPKYTIEQIDTKDDNEDDVKEFLDELAFLVMDLEARGENRLADLLLNTYLEHNHCLKAEVDLNLFYYFKAYRAAVRAKVNLLHTGKAQQLRADRYLDLMECYADQFIIRN